MCKNDIELKQMKDQKHYGKNWWRKHQEVWSNKGGCHEPKKSTQRQYTLLQVGYANVATFIGEKNADFMYTLTVLLSFSNSSITANRQRFC